MPTIWVDFYSVSVSLDTRLGWLGSSTKLSYLPTDHTNEKSQFMRFVSFRQKGLLYNQLYYVWGSRPTTGVCKKVGTKKGE